MTSLGQEMPDLTGIDLRGVSPVYCLYLANMGVRASLAFAVITGGSLQALVTAHHREPLPLPPNLIEVLYQRVRSFGINLAFKLSQQRMVRLSDMAHRFDTIRGSRQGPTDLVSAWPEIAAWLMKEFQLDGAMLCLGQSTTGGSADRCNRLNGVVGGTGIEPVASTV